MTDKPTAPPRPAAATRAPPAAPMEQVGYLGLTHFLRAKSHVAAAVAAIGQAPLRPDASAVGEALGRFAKVTPDLAGATLVDYFLALVERELQLRGAAADPLGIYLLHAELVKAQRR